MAAPATILLFHSAPLVRQVIREILEQAGYVVRATGDLGIAVDMVRETPPDLLLIDVYVANISGRDAALYLRQKRPALRVLFLAGVPADERLDVFVANERFLVFPSPFAPAALIARVKEILQRGERR
jgi:two-component system phosphate regulon response regulator OmpR